MSYSLNELYEVVGISKQAVIQYEKRQELFDTQVSELLEEVELLRREHPGCGVEKMYYTLKPQFLGRDRFIELFMNLGFRVQYKKNYRRTTFSAKVYHPNLIEGMLVYKPSQVWQSDITYIEVGNRFYYAVFIIDVYTKLIVGYKVSDHLRAEANMKALEMAVREYEVPAIHHSDKGSQYIYRKYTGLLKSVGTSISMGDTALDNAYAERINQTIKNEYLAYWKPQSYKALQAQVEKAVNHYNTKRPHNHLAKKAPKAFAEDVANLSMCDRPFAIIYSEGYHREVKRSNIRIDKNAIEKQTYFCPMNIKMNLNT